MLDKIAAVCAWYVLTLPLTYGLIKHRYVLFAYVFAAAFLGAWVLVSRFLNTTTQEN